MQLKFSYSRRFYSKYFQLAMEMLDKINVKFGVGFDQGRGAAERLPIFLVMLGAEIRKHEDELSKEFETIGSLF